jgi:gliding motility-associated-like protein
VLVNIDDIWTPVINMPFCFQFFGNTYTQLVIGSNGLISFNTAYANAFCQWNITAAIPSAGNPINSIMAPYHDIDPSIGATSDIRYQVYGTAPCREFVVSFYNIPMYSGACNSQLASQQIVLHETTNIIDIYITNKPLCATWNAGAAIQGIQNAAGTVAVVVPGRNFPTNWAATNDGKRFMPTGTPQYTLNWTGPSGSLGSANPITVCPTTTTTYTCTVTNTTCSGNVVVSSAQTVTIAAPYTLTPSQTNITCFGACTGSATVVPSIPGSYTYSWAPTGGNSATASGLCAGTYTVTATNSTACSVTQTFTITQPPAITATQSQVNVTCNGFCNGSATVVAGGGNGTYTYSWSPSGGSGPTASGLCAGTYTCTISSPVGCSITRIFTITEPPAITATQSQVNVTCNGACTGSATVVAAGGTGTYTYLWAPSGGTGPTASGLCAGTYTCTISSPAGCSITSAFNITQPPAITATQSQVNLTCNGVCTGSATVVAAGGTGSYTYSWAPTGGTGATASGLCAGTYTCTISSPAGCFITRIFTITQPPALTASTTTTPATCGGTNGTATVTAAGGVGPYTYAWAPIGGTGTTASNLPAGSYTVTVTSVGGCTVTAVAVVTSTGGIAASITATNNVTCFGGNNGSATATPIGGSSPYSYVWTPSGGNAATGTPLSAGSYTCTITDANGCIATASVTITEPPVITATQSQVNILCNGTCTGSATVVASGGTGTYTYAWTPSGGTGATASALCAGNYTCTISSPAGCSITRTFTITQPPAITATQSQVNITCNGACTGSATVVAAGGNGTYTYSWAPTGGTGPTASALCAGTYTCTISSPAGCSITSVFSITQPTAVTASATTTPSTCGNPNGTATVTPGGGTGPYTFSWNTTPLQTTNPATGLLPGSYTVTVTDANGCSTTAVAIVGSAGGPTASILSSTNIVCFGGTGSATATQSGGTGPFSYSWNSTPVQNTATATGLPAGSYTVTVTDANSCISTATVTITQNPAITATQSQVNVLCNGACTGTATVVASGGTGTYTYAWSPTGGTGATASGLCAGTYTCTISSPAGCSITQIVTITQPPLLTVAISSTPTSCNGGSNGTTTGVPSGGTGLYTYVWNSTPVQTTATATGLPAGNYTVTVTDQNGCTATASVAVTQPTAVTATTTTTASTCGNPNGTATVIPAGGTSPYTFSWNTVPVQTSNPATGLLAGSYTVTVTDDNGCTATAVAIVSNTGGPVGSIAASTNIACFGGSTGSATATQTGGTGPFTYSWNSTPVQNTATAVNLPAGSYTVTVTDDNGCISTATVTLTQNPAITATQSQVNVLCNGSCTGVATVVASGGTGTYTYTWTPSGGTGASATSLCAGTYSCIISSPAGCSITQPFSITEPPALTTTSSQVNVLCNGANTGSATVTPAGGVGPYTYSWNTSPAQTNATATALVAGSYTCIVTDANLCSTSVTFTITQPPALTATTTFVQSTCGNANGTATVTIGGGVPLYGISWNTIPVQTTPTATGLAAGTYTVTITDANSCTITATVTVPNAGSPAATITSSTNVSCFGGNNGDATVTASSGTPPYTYSWNTAPVQTTATATGLIAGNYIVTVTDSNGCVAADSVIITEPPVLTMSAASTDVACFGDATGTASVTVGGGTPGYSYSWNSIPVQAAANATGLFAGSYICVVTDTNGCMISQSVTITEPPQLTLAIAGFNVSCFNSCDGQVVVIPTGGVPNYGFSWNTGCNMPSCNNICAGSYTVTVTDQNGCVTTASTTVTEPTPIVINTSAVDAHCNLPDGSAASNANGGTGTLTYQWIGGPANANYNTIPAGTYSVIVTDANGCADTATATVNNLNGVNATLTSVTDLTCFNSNDGVIVTGASGGIAPYTYLWTAPAVSVTGSASSLSAGAYTLTVTDSSGCTSTVSATVTQPTAVTLTASATPPAVCAGASVQLAATGAGGTPGYTYEWMPGTLLGNTQNIVPAATTTYTVYVEDANGCSDSTTVLVTVNPVPVATLTADITSGCEALCVEFTDQSTVAAPGVINSWSWDFGDSTPISTTQNPSHCFATSGVYTVILNITTTDGCVSTITMPSYITVFANPVAAFGASPQPATILDPLIHFTDSSSTNVTAWSWSFGDLSHATSSLQNPSFAYPEPTCYEVVLAVATIDGCVDTTSKGVCIGPDATIYVPNAFTPNDDGTNDFFFPVQIGIDPTKYEMWIFDRWGNMIFYTDDLAKPWDGTVQGSSEICQIDTYVWKIKATDILGGKHDLQGKVSIVK